MVEDVIGQLRFATDDRPWVMTHNYPNQVSVS